MDLMIVIEDAIADAVAHAMVDGRAGHTGRNGLSPWVRGIIHNKVFGQLPCPAVFNC